jgi:hypothetical protein
LVHSERRDHCFQQGDQSLQDDSDDPGTPPMSPQSSSRTMAIATTPFRTAHTATGPVQQPPQPRPLTATEQYWATRALRAEALLEAQHAHKKEVQTMGAAHDMKREVSTFQPSPAPRKSIELIEIERFSVSSALLRRSTKKSTHT